MRAGTIVATNYLEMARLLGRSFLAAHPGASFAILLVDDHPADTADDGIDLVRLGDLPIEAETLDLMKTIYDVMELSTAVKPAFLQLLLDDDDLACYIDPDIYVYEAFDDLVAAARTVGIVLTPHVLAPIPRDGLAPTERMIMQSGIFNLGFIAVGRPALGFLDWWHERLVIDAVSDVEANLFTDQRWIDWVPSLFDHEVCRDPGMNISWWNIHERRLEVVDGSVTANGHPVRFVHFSGYSPTSPDVFSKHHGPAPRADHVAGSPIRMLAEEYGSRLLESGHADRSATPYQWSQGADGTPLTRPIRDLVRRAVLAGERTGSEAAGLDDGIPLAFGPRSIGFRDWLTAPGSEHFSRVEVALWESRPDLIAAFPDREGADHPRYRDWLERDPGAHEALGDLIPPAAPRLPDPPTSRRVVRGALRRLRAAVAALRA